MGDCILNKATVILKFLIIIVYNYSINLTLAETINALSSFRVYVNTANPEFLFFFTFTTRSLYMIYKATFSCSLTTNDYKCKQLIQDKIVTASQTGIFHFPESPLLKKQQTFIGDLILEKQAYCKQKQQPRKPFQFFTL